MRAVPPLALRGSTLAPRCSSSFATRSCPPAAAACSSPFPFLANASHVPTLLSPCAAARPISSGSGSGAGLAEGGPSEDPPSSCRLAGLSSTASTSPSTATSYRPLAASKRSATPYRPLSSGRAWRPSMRTRWPERLGVDAVVGGLAACCRSSSAMAAWPVISAPCSTVKPCWSRSSMLAPASSSSCTHSMCPTVAAAIRAVLPPALCRSMLALCSSSKCTTRWPVSAAPMRAVAPLVSRRSMLAPRFSSSFATCKCPPCAAACSSPFPSSSSVSTCPPPRSQSTTDGRSPLFAAVQTSRGSGGGSGNVPPRATGACSGGQEAAGLAEACPSSCRFAGLSSTASASPSTATSYRPLAASKRPATPHRPLSSGRAWRPPMRTQRPERLSVGAATVAGGVSVCCRSSLAMAALPVASASCDAVRSS
eukprot:scaffold138427_cov66-Phaeocystis_antarctica.AAC.4